MLNKTMLITVSHFARSALIILFFLYLGKGLQYISHLPVSGSIFGLLLLFLAMNIRMIPLNYVLPAGSILLNYITLFFVPVGVGLLQYSNLLSMHWLTIVVSSVVSTLAVLLSVGWIYQRLTK
jgi:holin-like protein